LGACHSFERRDRAATIKKAMPVQSRSPVKKYNTTATKFAGIRTRNSLIKTTIIKPIIIKTISAVNSSSKFPESKEQPS